jgi:CBS domain-containing protein
MGDAIPTARDLMVRKLVTFRPEAPIHEAISQLLRNEISGGPVVGADGELLGLLSEFDCLKAVASGEFFEEDTAYARDTVADLMTTECHTVSPDMDLYAITSSFLTLGVRRLPVVENGRVIGQVSRRDVLREVERLYHQRHSRKRYPDYPADRRPIDDYPAHSGHPRSVKKH